MSRNKVRPQHLHVPHCSAHHQNGATIQILRLADPPSPPLLPRSADDGLEDGRVLARLPSSPPPSAPTPLAARARVSSSRRWAISSRRRASSSRARARSATARSRSAAARTSCARAERASLSACAWTDVGTLCVRSASASAIWRSEEARNASTMA